jgi:NADH-quinone oxidoreductase subunit C
MTRRVLPGARRKRVPRLSSGSDRREGRVSKFALDKVAAAFPNGIAERYDDRPGDAWAVLKAEALPEVMRFLKTDAELEFKLFLSMDAVDRLLLPQNDPRFELVYFLYSPKRNEHVRLKVRVSEAAAELPTVSHVFQGANWWERLAWDFYGIRFKGHKDLRRLLLYEEFKGHPLRKDYPLRGRQPLIPERPIKDIFRGPGTSGVA